MLEPILELRSLLHTLHRHLMSSWWSISQLKSELSFSGACGDQTRAIRRETVRHQLTARFLPIKLRTFQQTFNLHQLCSHVHEKDKSHNEPEWEIHHPSLIIIIFFYTYQ